MNAMPSKDNPVSRRDFLALTWKGLLTLSGLLALGGVLRFLNYQTEAASPTEFDLGPAGNFAVGSRTVIPAARAILLSTPQGFVALSLVCPHLGCEVEPKPEGFACPCHGSRFDPQGALLRGPADRPLRSLRIEKMPDRHLILHTD
jgi:cytochrome b6-f complex iron-sulfur subunit